MRTSTFVALAWSFVALALANGEAQLPAFAAYHAVEPTFRGAKTSSFNSPENRLVHYDPKPIVLVKDVFEFRASTTEYGSAPAPGLAVRFTNEGYRSVARVTSKEDKSQFVIVAGGQTVGQIEGGELWRIGTLRLTMLITLPKTSGALNKTLERSVNEAKEKSGT